MVNRPRTIGYRAVNLIAGGIASSGLQLVPKFDVRYLFELLADDTFPRRR
jgi:hypothetical protein